MIREMSLLCKDPVTIEHIILHQSFYTPQKDVTVADLELELAKKRKKQLWMKWKVKTERKRW